jgi:hypothetical protein
MKKMVSIIIIICVGIGIFLFGIIKILPIIYKNSVNQVQRLILEKHSEVESVTVLYDHGIYSLELTLDIIFYDGRTLQLERVDKKGKGDIRIRKINGFGFRGYSTKASPKNNSYTQFLNHVIINT